ncbi:MAG TPA: cytochrome c peroxidase, partial [Flavobacterium sp.]
HYADYADKHFNGAPLLHIEKTGTSAQVLEPEGLQVLDEMIFSPEANENKNNIASISKRLMTSYGILYENIQNVPISNLAIAMRLQLIRIYTLGLTGFDTPGSLNAIPEAVASLEGMHNLFVHDLKHGNSKNADQVEKLFEQSIAVLRQASFENLDRLDFLKLYIDPLYNQLSSFQIEKIPEFLTTSSSWNSKSKSIFSDNFLNPYFFSELKEGEDNEDVRTLGKLLFYDPILSNSKNMSCVTCHQPDKGFADGNITSLSSVQGKTVLRNAPSLVNSVYADRYFYDVRAFTLEQQVEHVIFSSDEFNTSYNNILKKLQANPNYIKKFKKAFGKSSITRENFSKALASYVLSLRSFNSSLDQYIRNETKIIDPEVKNGFNLFMGKANCATCHFAPTFSGLVPPYYSDSETEILGVLADSKSSLPELDADEGRWANKISSEYAWIYEKSFKTTTIRNADLTPPYFHNGAYKTLEDVIEFYDKGGGEGLGVLVHNQTLSPEPLELSQKEKAALISFIKSLNDIPLENK